MVDSVLGRAVKSREKKKEMCPTNGAAASMEAFAAALGSGNRSKLLWSPQLIQPGKHLEACRVKLLSGWQLS